MTAWLYSLILTPLVVWMIAWLCFRILFIWLSKKLRKKLNLGLSISKIHPTYLEGISIEKEGLVSVNIHHIQFSSKWINSQCNKPFTLYVGPFTVTILKTLERNTPARAKTRNLKKDNVLVSAIAANTIKFFLKHIGVVLQDLSVTATLFDTVINWTSEVNLQFLKDIHNITFEASFTNCSLTALHDDLPLLYMSHNLSVRMCIPPGKPINAMSHIWRVTNLQLDLTEDLTAHIISLQDKKRRERYYIEEMSRPPEDTVEESCDEDNKNKLQSLLSSLPQGLKLLLENFKIVYRLHSRRELQMDWNCVLSWQRFQPDKHEAILDVLGFVINGTDHCKLLLFKQMMIKMSVYTDGSANKIQLFNKMDTCHIDYIHKEILFWRTHFSIFRSSGDSMNKSHQQVVVKPKSSLLTNTVITADNTLENCSCDLYVNREKALTTSVASVYLGKLELCVSEARLDEKKCGCAINLTDMYSYIDAEEILPNGYRSFPCQLEHDQPAVQPSTLRHAWGRVFEIGEISLNCDIQPGCIDCKCGVTFVAFEWSLAMGDSILHLLKDMDVDNVQTHKKNVRKGERQWMKVDIDVEINNINMFIIGEKEGGFSSLICKMDEVSIVKGAFLNVPFMKAEVHGIIISQLKELSQMKTGDSFYCRKSDRFDYMLLSLPLLTGSVKTLESQKVVSIEIKEINIDWNPNVHMAIHEHICNLESFLASSKDVQSMISSPSPTKSPSTLSVKYTINIPDVFVKMDTTEGHRFSVKSKTIEVGLDGNEMAFQSQEITLYFDDIDIFTFANVEVKNVPKNVLSNLRNQLNLYDTSNRTWSIEIHSLDIVFPYEFNFAKSLEHFQLIIKMLKVLHKKAKGAEYVEPLPPDLQISCKVIRIMFDDDPFEVQLGCNYMLLLDEMEQAKERDQYFEERLDQFKSEIRTMLPGKQIEAWREKLKVENSKIYIQRSKAMYEDHSPRKTLFHVEVKDLKLIVLADSLLHGKDNVLKHMMAVNPESPIPEDIQFSTLWCRMMNGEFNLLKMLIRDYPQPLMQVEKFSSRGMVIGAEACGVKTAMGDGKICVGYPWEDIMVTKNMQPLKFYYDLKWDMSSFQMAYGANVEPAMAMVNQAFEMISKPSVDPSLPMPYWDKMRLFLHGNLKMDAAELIILMIASIDPHNTTEKLEIEWSAVTIEWTNGKVSIDGNYFDMTTHTASKYDDSRVCHFPNFKMVYELQWVCDGNGNDHHNVYPTHPKYVKFSNHDSYAKFRSSNLNMNLTFGTCMDQSKESVEIDPPFIFLYASTFRWFQHYQNTVINRVSRPIKRGKYFSNVKPRKPTLGRHLKLLEIELTFPSLNVTYWGSYEKEIGFDVTIGKGSLAVAYQVFISPHPDSINLIRRPVANWIIRGLSSIMDNVRVLVLQSSDLKLEADDCEDETLCIEDEDAEKKHYLFSVDKIEYKRLSIIIEDSYTHKILLQNFRGAWTAINRELTLSLFEAYSKMQRLKKVLSSDALKLTSDSTQDVTRKSSYHSPYLDRRKVPDSVKSPMTSLQSGYGDSLLQKLVLESESKFMIELEEEKPDTADATPDEEDEQDVLQRNWHIELVNSQVLLHGTETKGAIVVTSGNATILKRLHHPVNVRTDVINKMNKVTWRGKFRNLQCFCTEKNFKDITVDNIPWLTTDIISDSGEDNSQVDPHDITLSYTKLSNIVGAFVEVRIGDVTHQLQRVIARTECEFRLLNLDIELDPAAEEFIPKSSEEFSSSDSGANTVDLKLGKLEMSTSNSQYSVVRDICQNLIFHTEQKKKEGQEKLEKMKFKLHLNTPTNEHMGYEDMKNNVSQLQTRVRDTLMMLRHYEREFYNYKKKLEVERAGESDMVVEIEETMSSLQEQIEETKLELFEDVEELKILIRAYKDVNITMNNVPMHQKGVSHTRKKVDVHLDDLQWSLTKDDGHLTMSHAHIKNFRYNQLNYNDNSTEHRFEVGNFALKNLLPNEIYQEALMPHEFDIRRLLDKMVALRIYCRISPAVAGIMVKDHFEVNVCPIKVQMSHKFVHQMESFFFPHKEEYHENIDQQEFKLGMLAVEGLQREPSNKESNKEETAAEISKSETASISNQPPQRPPPPSSMNRTGTFRRQRSLKESISSVPEYDTVSLSSTQKLRKPVNLNMHSVNEAGIYSSAPVLSPLSPSVQHLSRNSSFRRSNVSLNSMKDSALSAIVDPDRDVNTMKERAAKNQTFIYVKIPQVSVCFSYKGEKERNIEDAHNFNLCLPTLEYHSRTWTWQDLFQALKKDYIQVLVPQILKEKLHLKSAGADTKPSIAKDNDTNKARLLLGENQPGASKKSAKKLFGKLINKQSKQGKLSVPENLSEVSASTSNVDESKELVQVHSGTSVEESNLEDDFKRLRDISGDNE